eukprot:SAG11_NODE_262_length_11529_cov_12.277603_7_plen_292_part_00
MPTAGAAALPRQIALYQEAEISSLCPVPPPTLDRGGVVRTSCPQAVRALVRKHGYCVVDGQSCANEHDTQRLAAAIWSTDLLAAPGACEVHDGAVGDDGLAQDDPGARLLGPHSDGFAYGDALPDFFLLACAEQSSAGGENFLVDGMEVLADIGADRSKAWAVGALQTRPIEQTEPGKRPAISPIVKLCEGGRLMFRHLPSLQKAWVGSDDAVRDQAMVGIFHEATARLAAGASAKWLKLSAGDVSRCHSGGYPPSALNHVLPQPVALDHVSSQPVALDHVSSQPVAPLLR